LDRPATYEGFQRLLGADATRNHIVKEILKAKPGDRILDLGCGTGTLLEHLPPVEYVGIDCSEAYICDAERRLGARGTFIAADVRNFPAIGKQDFDLAIAIGLLHHLDDAEARTLVRNAIRHLKPGGRFVALDPLIESPQHPIARLLALADRGRFVRTLDGYEALAAAAFNVKTQAKRNLLRIPYSHSLLVATAA
jgi:SAM-dependent methyltransferase